MESGLHFGEFGPGDQGAYSKFYQGQFDVVQLEAITGATLPPQGSCTATGPSRTTICPTSAAATAVVRRIAHARFLKKCREPVRGPAPGPNGLPLGGEAALKSIDGEAAAPPPPTPLPSCKNVTDEQSCTATSGCSWSSRKEKCKKAEGVGCTIFLGEWQVWRDKVRNYSSSG